MGSISSTNSNLSNLLQTLQAESPQLSSILSTPNMQSALENASPGDLVQLSDQALQLQQVGLLFGNPDGTQSTGFTQIANGASGFQAQELNALFGTPQMVDPFLNTLG